MHTYRFIDPRLPVPTPPTHLGRIRTSDDPLGDALALLSQADEKGVHLTRAHVEMAARLTGCRFDWLWDTILNAVVR